MPIYDQTSLINNIDLVCNFVMGDLFSTFSFLFTFIGLVFLILKVRKKLNATGTTSNLPPGPWMLPLVGSIHHLIGSPPHHRLRKLAQKYGPLMHLKLGEKSTIVVSSPEVAKAVMKNHESSFDQRPHFLGEEIVGYGCTIAFSPYGDYWKQLRKICTLELLSQKRVQSFRLIREDEVANLARYISTKTGSSINLSEKIFSMTYAISARTIFGENCKLQEAFITLFREAFRLAGGFIVADLFPSQNWLHVISGIRHKFEEVHSKTDMLLEEIISNAVRKIGRTETEGLLSVLLNLKDHGALEFPLTINNIKAVILDMFIGGSQTSSTTIEWVISEMLKNPKVLKRAQAEVRQVFGSRGYLDDRVLQELEFLKAVVKETLRLHPPAVLIPRECRKTSEINGYTIHAGTQVFVNAWAIGRDPEYWNEAEKFCPERFLACPTDYKGSNFEFIPFGAGKRICPGMLYAVANVELALAQLLYYFDWELPLGTTYESLDMTESFGTTVRRKTDLFVVPISYSALTTE